VYPDPRVERLIDAHFVPVRVHVKDQAKDFQQLGERYGAKWTPVTLVLSPDGKERHRIEGFLPADDFLSQLSLGLGRVDFDEGRYAEAEKRFRGVVERHPNTDAAPEALYWAGAAKYRATNDPKALAETGRAFRERYKDTAWAKKASVWNK
jgi:tetratricopeptide (TPR) repeat protein